MAVVAGHYRGAGLGGLRCLRGRRRDLVGLLRRGDAMKLNDDIKTGILIGVLLMPISDEARNIYTNLQLKWKIPNSRIRDVELRAEMEKDFLDHE